MNQKRFVTEVEARLLAIFNAYERGEDVPPALVFRTEGFIEAGCSMGLVIESDMVALIQRLHKQVFNTELTLIPSDKIHIPSLMKRAPVYPSTHK